MRGCDLVGKRIEIPVHYDLWMRGAMYGEVTSFRRSHVAGQSDYVLVKMDNTRVRGRVKIWSIDWDYCRIL